MSDQDAPPVVDQDVRAPRIAMVGVGLVALTLVVAAIGVVAAVVQLSDDDPPDPVVADVLIDDARFPVALTPTADGGFLYGEKESGAVRKVSPTGALDPDPVAAFEVASEGQRGLLGLAEVDGELYASLVRASDGRLVVLRAADQLEVWVGPESTDLANGGHLLALGDGRILIGVGDLQDREARDRSDTVNGKLLALEPAGPSDQQPEVLSAGWNNPFAFVRTGDGTIWVADNAPGSEPERIGRGDRSASEATDLEGERAPSALVELPDGDLAVCGFVSQTLDAVDVDVDVGDGDGMPEAGASLLVPCRTGAAVLADGRVLTATESQILVATLPAA